MAQGSAEGRAARQIGKVRVDKEAGSGPRRGLILR